MCGMPESDSLSLCETGESSKPDWGLHSPCETGEGSKPESCFKMFQPTVRKIRFTVYPTHEAVPLGFFYCIFQGYGTRQWWFESRGYWDRDYIV
jgi:hypothetical protein